jgi:hypothetical protein
VIVHPVTSVELIKIGEKHFVDWLTNGRDARRFGPYPNAAIAQAKADKLIAHLQPSTPPVPTTTNDNLVVLRDAPTKLDSDEGRRFVRDAVRAAEGLITDDDLREKYELTAKNLKEIAKNPALVKAVRDERERRVRTGIAARESAARHFVKAPDVMNSIMSDQQANPRHRIESARELRATASSGGEENGPNAGEVFHIVINLGENEKFEKEVVLKPPQPPLIEGEIDAGEQ